MLVIREDDLSGEAVRGLIAFHRSDMRDSSPPEHSFALDLSGLQSPDITVWSAWSGEELAGIGALKRLSDRVGEVKSMRTHPGHLRKGVGRAILERIIETARAEGLRKLSLETGTGELFEAALSLYRRRGFVEGEAFGDYSGSDFNRFFHLDL